MLGQLKVNQLSRRKKGRFQDLLSRVAATLFSSMTEAEAHFGNLIGPDRSVTVNSLVSLLIMETSRKTLFPATAVVNIISYRSHQKFNFYRISKVDFLLISIPGFYEKAPSVF